MTLKELAKRCLVVTYPLLGALPPKTQKLMENRFDATTASLVSATAEFIMGFSVFFMLLNGVFTNAFLRHVTLSGTMVLGFTAFAAMEGIFRIFYIVLGRGTVIGSVLYWVIFTPIDAAAKAIKRFAVRIPKRKKMTEHEKKKKQTDENFKKFIEYGMDNPSLTFAR